MTFGSKLQALRAGAGLSQEELAARLGVSRQAVTPGKSAAKNRADS